MSRQGRHHKADGIYEEWKRKRRLMELMQKYVFIMLCLLAAILGFTVVCLYYIF